MVIFSIRLLRQCGAASLGAALLGGAGAGHAATCKTLYSFKGGKDGANPEGALISVGSTLYGTTQGGGKNNVGTVYSVTASGAEKVVYSFGSGEKGGTSPVAALLDLAGSLYGTTTASYGAGYGTVFRVTTAGAGKLLYTFKSTPDGAYPDGALINLGGELYGTTLRGGKYGYGTVFQVTEAGKEKVLYSFKGYPHDGANPQSTLVDVDGTLYGTTTAGGTADEGTVFSVTAAGAETVLHSFNVENRDGSTPYAALLNVGGTLYGTTYVGGSSGVGTVFSVTTAGVEKVLYSFRGGNDGDAPYAGLVSDGSTLYGTTSQAGSGGGGTVFSVTTAGAEKVVCSFASPGGPDAGLLLVGSTLYGTTYEGGTDEDGVVFSVTP